MRFIENAARRRAFTLIELLVVVAIIALLISILLPSLKCARETARAAKCGVQLRSLGSGLAAYFTENNDWIPGVNTTGVVTTKYATNLSALRLPSTPVQSFDWISPALRYEMEMGDTRAKQWQTITNEFRCPSTERFTVDELYDGGSPPVDAADFTDDSLDEFSPLSYLMPVHFQVWGQNMKGRLVGTTPGGRPRTAMVLPTNFSMIHWGSYTSRKDKVGLPADKVMAADGTRYLDASGVLDFDYLPSPPWFGSFASNGAWWAGSQAYGVRPNTLNWDDTSVSHGSAAEGKNMLLSYRHGCSGANTIDGVRDNKGAINAMFFDGHVARLEDRASRNPNIWYPKGSKPGTSGPADGLVDLPDDYEVP